MRNFAVALSALASAATVNAAAANIYNRCSIPVFLWPVDADRPAGAPITLQPGASYSEQYHTPSNGGGVSLKINTQNSLDIITQFEYTLTGGMIWYDGSNVNCPATQCPFFSLGAYLETSIPSCPTRTCTPGQVCTGFYQYPTDDINSLACQPDADVNLYLCATSASAPAPAPPAAVSSKATPSPTPTIAPTPVAIVAAEVKPTTTTAPPKFQMEAILRPKVNAKRFVVPHAHARRHEH
jgi:hypothetical protein